VKLVDALEQLSNACGVTGREDEVRKLLKTMLKPYVDEIKEDKMGNVIGIKKAKKKAPKVMLAAHMDEIGLIVKNITKDGFLQFAKLGGIADRILIAQRVLVHTRKGKKPGIIGSKPPVVSFDTKFVKINKDVVLGKAFDDRVGCCLLVEVMKQLKNVDCTVLWLLM